MYTTGVRTKLAMNLTSLAFLTILLPSASARVESHRKLNKVQQGEAIPGQYVIELDSGVGDSRGFTARVLQRSLRSNVIENYDFALKGFAVKDLPDEVLDFLLNLDDVLSVSEDGFVEMDQVQAGPTWGLDVIDGSDDDKYTYSFTGKGVDAYILDTGIAAHSDFEGRVASCISFANEGKLQVSVLAVSSQKCVPNHIPYFWKSLRIGWQWPWHSCGWYCRF